MSTRRILVIRLGAMGDIIHALPAVASLKTSIPDCHLTWVVERKWRSLLEANPYIDELFEVDRVSFGSLLEVRRRLREQRWDVAVDLQGLMKSAVIASASRAEKIFGFDKSLAREALATVIYSHPVKTSAVHIVDQYLAIAADAGATTTVKSFHLPEGKPEGELGAGDFVLASPYAGWASKQWPSEYFSELGRRLRAEDGLRLVLNVAPRAEQIPNTEVHVSGIPGLIDATRRAVGVVGVDSGPLHIGAALGKPGVAIFGPTDPARNGPYGDSITVLRSPGAITSYKRRDEIDESMREITVDMVLQALRARMRCGANRS